ncbi:hypothetical protein J6590_024984 [Homalodisca vitripennis]|nr:hypothetical protein J6590_024984 [Homalodisca vitripennis]
MLISYWITVLLLPSTDIVLHNCAPSAFNRYRTGQLCSFCLQQISYWITVLLLPSTDIVLDNCAPSAFNGYRTG